VTPTIDEFVAQIEAVSGATGTDPDTPVAELSDVDSMDLMEWLFGYQSEHPTAGVEATVFANDDGAATLRTFHTRLVETAARAAV